MAPVAEGAPSGAEANPGHILALDGLRGLAILLVIPHNADTFSHSAAWLWPLEQLAHAGWIGVQLFFVLSGFLITRNLLATRHRADYLPGFFLRRVLRIFPLYFLTLLLFLVLLPLLVPFSAGALASHDNQVWLWTFTSNWAQPHGLEVSGYSHFWSLAVEEQFYLLWPFVVLLAVGPRLLWICLGLVLVALVSRALLVHAGAKPELAYMYTHCRMDALALGAAVATLARNRSWSQWLVVRARLVLLLSVLSFAVTAWVTHTLAVYDPRTLSFGQTLLALSFAAVIALLAALPADHPGLLRRALESRALRTVGRVSFAMYVFHLPLTVAFGDSLERALEFTGQARPLAYALVVILLTFLAALASWHLLEKHFLALKTRLAPMNPAPATR
jgi:peptidoglycan/LPS O-acetylase OafA/YrhL